MIVDKKLLSIFLLFIGLTLVCGSVGFAVLETANVDIVGGSGMDTFLYVFCKQNHGGYSIAAAVGAVIAVVSFIVYPIKRK